MFSLQITSDYGPLNRTDQSEVVSVKEQCTTVVGVVYSSLVHKLV